ncbi:hypothetical protein GCM10023196_086600 [Actinoallomurus vinaceus]|uniref:CU044_5270 family protein n=1 Tax=Actinoallomurus vinaceus TaxID=1080074 RepID=A0ABP8UPU1_9ACTN
MKGQDMDEMQLLRTARPEVPSYPEEAREAVRAALAAAADGTGPRRRGRSSRSLRWSLAAAAGGLAVAVGVAALVQEAGTRGAGTGGRAPAHTSTGTVVNAAQVLLLAADTVEARPATHPRPSQWAYTKEMSYSSQTTTPAKPTTAERWMRFDGTQEASLGGDMPGVDPHRLRFSNLDHDADETTPMQDYAYLASLPTDPKALVKKFCSRVPAKAADHTSCLFTNADKLLPNVAMPPRLQAAFFRALAALPNIVVRRDVVDLAGRHDIAVAEAFPGDFQSEVILLDPRTYEYRGQRLEWTTDPNEAPPGPGRTPQRVLGSPTGAGARHAFTETTRIAAGIVDRPGTRP